MGASLLAPAKSISIVGRFQSIVVIIINTAIIIFNKVMLSS